MHLISPQLVGKSLKTYGIPKTLWRPDRLRTTDSHASSRPEGCLEQWRKVLHRLSGGNSDEGAGCLWIKRRAQYQDRGGWLCASAAQSFRF